MPSSGTTSQRGYGSAHQRQRQHWAPKVNAGTVTCPRCNTIIRPGQPWDLGHQQDRDAPTRPEHAGRDCPAGGNRATARSQRRQPEPHPGIRPA